MKSLKKFNEALFEYDEQMFKDTFGLSTEELIFIVITTIPISDIIIIINISFKCDC